MNAMLRNLPGVLIIASTLLPTGCERKESDASSWLGGPGDADANEQFGSPDCVFEAARQASLEQDWQTYCRCLSPTGQSRLARTLLYGALMKDHLAKLTALMGENKGEEAVYAALDEFGFRGQYTSDPKRLDAMLERLNGTEQFICKMLAAHRTLNELAFPALDATAELTNLQVAMTSADAQVVQYREGNTYRDPIGFELRNGGWTMNFVFIPDVQLNRENSDSLQ